MQTTFSPFRFPASHGTSNFLLSFPTAEPALPPAPAGQLLEVLSEMAIRGWCSYVSPSSSAVHLTWMSRHQSLPIASVLGFCAWEFPSLSELRNQPGQSTDSEFPRETQQPEGVWREQGELLPRLMIPTGSDNQAQCSGGSRATSLWAPRYLVIENVPLGLHGHVGQ